MLKKQFTLRQYQQTFMRELAVAVKQHRRVIACAATGAGKSKTFLTIAANAIKKGYTVLVITESRKIYRQLINEVHAFEIKPGSKPPIVQHRIYLAMAQTLRRRQSLIDQFIGLSNDVTPEHVGLLIINDECHINEATGILLQMPSAALIGFSGSPVGKHLVKLYNHLVVGPQPHELVLQGFLTPYRHFERRRADVSQLETDSTGEYTEESQERVFGTDAVYDGIISDLTNPEFIWKKAIIFTSSIKHCEDTAERLRAANIRCVTVHSALKEREEYNLLQFMAGLIPVCVNVFILGKGFDYPPTDFIGLLIKTSSLARYLQAIGRASRILDGEENLPLEQRKKKLFYVFDYGQNVSKHLPWDFERDWQTLWRKEKQKRAGVSPIKICPQCDFVNAATAKTCVNCGYTWQSFSLEEPPQNVDTILVEVNAKYNKLVGRTLSSLTAEELAVYSKSKGKKQLAIRVAKWHCFDKGMHGDGKKYFHEFAKHMNYKSYFVQIQIEAMQQVLKSNPDEKFLFNDQILR